MVLHTQRMTLRPFRDTPEDLRDLCALAADPLVSGPANWRPDLGLEDCQRTLQRFVREHQTLAIEEEGRVIGAIDLPRCHPGVIPPQYRRLRCREIGYVLLSSCRGQGRMVEAVRALSGYLFASGRVDALFGLCAPDNLPSARVQEQCGFRLLGRRRLLVSDVMRTLELRVLEPQER